MKTVLYGKVTAQHLLDAALFSGIEPSSFITNGTTKPPNGLPCEVIPPDPMTGEAAPRQNHWRMVIQGETLVCVGGNEHLVRAAESHGLLVDEA